MIKFKEPISLTVVNEFDEATDNIVSESEENFEAGEAVDASVFSVTGDYVDLEFGDGSIALGVLRSCFDVIESQPN